MPKIILLTLLLSLFSCAHNNHPHGQLKFKVDSQVTKNLKGHKWGYMYFSAQPSTKDIQSLRKEGFVTVINLRNSSEGKYRERAERKSVKKAGLNYYNFPYSPKTTELTSGYVDKVTQAVVKHKTEGKVLIHCSTGNRVALWFGGHVHKDLKMPSDIVIGLAKNMGMTKKAIEERLVEYIER